MRQFGQWLLDNPINAAIVTLVCAFLPFVGIPSNFIVGIILALVTLRNGAKAGLFVLFWAALPTIALFFIKEFELFDAVLLRYVMMWLLSIVLRQTASWIHTLYFMAVLGIMGVLVFHLLIEHPVDFWSSKILSYLMTFSKDTAIALSQIKQRAHTIAHFTTGAVALIFLISLFVQLFIARFWQALLFYPGGLRREALNIRTTPLGTIFAVCAVSVGVLLHLDMVLDMMPVLMLPFIIAALSLLHLSAEQWVFLKIGLIVCYLAIIIFPYLLLLLVVIGGADCWVNFRERFHLTL